MKVEVDPDLCVGSAFCVETCPDVFEMSGEVAVVKVDTVPSEHEDACRQAKDECPSGAILITED
jgi:ferredoxin